MRMKLEALVEKLSNEFFDMEIKLGKRKLQRNLKQRDGMIVAMRYILSKAYRSAKSTGLHQFTINHRAGFYSKEDGAVWDLPSYRSVKGAYDFLKDEGYIFETKKGFYDRETGAGETTRSEATFKLCALLDDVTVSEELFIPALDSGQLILRGTKLKEHTTEGKKRVRPAGKISYSQSPEVEKMTENLRVINNCLLRHWADLEIPDIWYKKSDVKSENEWVESIDFSKRTITRIFNNGSFEYGGRFYHAWWQNIPRDLRKHITIDIKRTVEVDYSQMHPRLLYELTGNDLGEEDAYGRVFAGQHRDVVKVAFNAMLNAESNLKRKPDGLDISKTGMTWPQMRNAILDAHKPIEEYFFCGKGGYLQYLDSQVAERVMLHYAAHDVPVLPVHDSFIVHHSYEFEIAEVMESMYSEVCRGNAKTKPKKLERPEASSDIHDFPDMSMEAILHADDHRLLWVNRNTAWNNWKLEPGNLKKLYVPPTAEAWEATATS